MRRFEIEVEAPSSEAIEFALQGKTRSGDRWEEVFSALPAMPIGSIVDLGAGIMPATDCANFVCGLLEPESAARFEVLIRDKDRIITDYALADITQRLFSAMTGRPTSPPVDSPGGSSDTGTTSTGGSSSQALTVVASTGPVS